MMLLYLECEVECPHCHSFHVTERPFPDRTTAERDHLYITCKGKKYFVGTLGHPTRFKIKDGA